MKFKHVDPKRWSFALALSPNGTLLACHRGSEPHVVELWDWKAGKKLTELDGFPSQVNALTFSPDGKLLATGDKFGTIRVWDPVTFKETAIFKGHASGISAAHFFARQPVALFGSRGRNREALEDRARTRSGYD